ncbi:Similar to VhaSFD: V-type proton ATPase subunit H (Drosophila melanogaster) [Cotesia congregata]|uniref:V-type proton ATPase subunit H n=1 Tax=Cotesia congregata TaxID=51543 RepID=A0A8J2HH89_COTCN|nr:Similar to VhaSFD: V-type proton ATPase subunit H (Drosophila melanogaster) [Cotesia congregata]
MADRANINQIIPALPEEKHAATSVLQQQVADIRSQKINWQSYNQSQMISQEDYDFIVGFDISDPAVKDAKLKQNPGQAAKTFLNLLSHISKDQTIQYILVMIDDMLQHASRKRESVWSPFLNLLNRQDGFIMNMTSRIIAKLACWSHAQMEEADLNFYLTWLKDQLKLSFEAVQESQMHAEVLQDVVPTEPAEAGDLHEMPSPNNEYIQSVARCLQMMLRVDVYRFAFISVDGISTLLSVLFNVIPILADILSDSVKEKVTRIILAVFRNLIEKVGDRQVAKEHCIAMVQCKVLKQLSILSQRKFDDEDITEDIEFLNDKLQASVQDLSSFDEYSTQVKSGRLEWSPVHKSSKFWRENASRLNEKNYELLRILVHLLETSKDPLVLSVASFDIGEYVRHYPRGKHVLEQLGGKQRVMQLLSHEDPNVRYEALIAVQKLMVHNWEYLGKQLEKEQTGTGGTSGPKPGAQVPAKA